MMYDLLRSGMPATRFFFNNMVSLTVVWESVR